MDKTVSSNTDANKSANKGSKGLSNIKENLNCFRDYLNHYKQIISKNMDLTGVAGVVSEIEIY